YTNSEAEKANVLANLSGTYTYEGVAWYAPPAGSTIAATVDVFRFFRLGVGTHLYTASVAERDNIIANLGQYYTYEGVAYKAWPLN
ncbi:MAG: serine protease, partial [Hydrogenophaga sp.]|nr:serine protease [Hydrogenophaga sp.]